MTQNPVLEGNGDFFLPGQGLGRGETMSILGKVIQQNTQLSESAVKKVSFAMIVIQAISYIGIERFTNQLQDIGSFQNQVGSAQSAFGKIQSGVATLEKNTYWDGKNAYFSKGMTNDNGKLSAMAKAIYELFNNQMTSTGNDSGTPTWANFTLSLPKPGGGFIEVKPFLPNGKPNGQSWTLVNDFIGSLNKYVFGGNLSKAISLPSSVSTNTADQLHMPIYIAMAMTEMQVKIDDYPQYMVNADGTFKTTGAHNFKELFQNGTLLNTLFGAFNADAPLEALQNMASLLLTKYDNGNTLLDEIDDTASSNFSAKALYQPFADMMADYMKSKYQGQPGGATDPSGYIANVKGWPTQYSSLSLFANLSTSATQGTSELQTQTQKNSADAQEDTTQINSYDQVGQTVVGASNKSQKTMVQGQKAA